MEEASISRSASGFSPEVAALSSADNANAVDGDRSGLELQVSAPLSPHENPGLLVVLSSKETAPGNLSPGTHSHSHSQEFAEISVNSCSLKSMSDCATICAPPCDAVKETKEPSSSDVQDMLSKGDCALAIGEGDCFFAAGNGKPSETSGSVVPEKRVFPKEATGFKVLGAAPGKLSEVRKDFRCSLEIELIDDTAVIGIDLERAVIGTQHVKKERKPRRRYRAAKNDSDENKNSSNLKVSTGNSTRNKRAEKAKKIAYSRKAMENLRYWNIKGQRKMWRLIYSRFSPTTKTEYEELGCSRNQNNTQSGLIWEINRAPPVLGVAAAQGGCLNAYVRQDNFSGFHLGRRNFV